MKRMKSFTVILAAIFVFASSAFKSRKFTTHHMGMYLTNGSSVPGQSNYTAFYLVDYDDVTGESCSVGSESRCGFVFNSSNLIPIDRTLTGAPQASDYGTYNWILLDYNTITKIQYVHIMTSGIGMLPLSFSQSIPTKVFQWDQGPF